MNLRSAIGESEICNWSIWSCREGWWAPALYAGSRPAFGVDNFPIFARYLKDTTGNLEHLSADFAVKKGCTNAIFFSDPHGLDAFLFSALPPVLSGVSAAIFFSS